MSATVRVQGKLIREARLAAGLSQGQLARMISTSERNIVRWETSKNQPRVESVAAIAEATGRDVDFFLTVDGAEASDDDEESDGSMTLDAFLHLRVRQVVREVVREELRQRERERS